MPTRRQHRLNELLREELSLLVPGRLDDPRLTNVRVTRVETTQDMATAKVYVTDQGAEEPPETMLAALDHAAGVLRGELAALGLRRLPQLVFAQDKAFESGERVLAILDRIGDSEDAPAGNARPGTGADEAPAGSARPDTGTDDAPPEPRVDR